jgi:hypothetical protein
MQHQIAHRILRLTAPAPDLLLGQQIQANVQTLR